MTLKTYPFDPAKYLTDPESQVELLQEAFETGHAGFIANVIATVARARRFSGEGRAAGATSEVSYKTPSPEGEPTLATLLEVVAALGCRLTLTPIEPQA